MALITPILCLQEAYPEPCNGVASLRADAALITSKLSPLCVTVLLLTGAVQGPGAAWSWWKDLRGTGGGLPALVGLP